MSARTDRIGLSGWTIVLVVHDLPETKATSTMSDDDQKPKEIHFTVDNETFTTIERELKPNYIITEYAKRDPTFSTMLRTRQSSSLSSKMMAGICVWPSA